MIYLAWSGGLDSTFALYDLLRRGYQVHAHHVSVVWGQRFATGEEQRALALGRAEAELAACEAIRLALQERGFEFGYSQVRIDWRDRQMRLADDMGTMVHVLSRAMAFTVEELDRIVYGANDQDYPRGDPLPNWRALIRMHCEVQLQATPIALRYGQWQGREAHVEALGDLASLTMSCRRPKLIDGIWTPCGSRKAFASRWAERYGEPRPCTCAHLIDLIPKYARGWACDEH